MSLDQLEKVLKAIAVQGFSIPQLTLLLSLRSGQLSMTDAAASVGHSTAAATGSVDRMEKQEYLSRSHATDDRRKIFVSLTTKGLLALSLLDKAISKIPTN